MHEFASALATTLDNVQQLGFGLRPSIRRVVVVGIPGDESASWRHSVTMTILFRLGALRALFRTSRLSWRLARDPRTPLADKLFLAAAIALIVSPINWIPSSIPILGQIEDLALVTLALNLFLGRVPAELRQEHETALGIS